MEEITIKLDIPSEFREAFKKALAKAIRRFEIDLEFAVADSILSKSKLTEGNVKELANKLKERVAKRHGP